MYSLYIFIIYELHIFITYLLDNNYINSAQICERSSLELCHVRF